MKIGKRLKRIIEHRRLSPAEVARRAHIPPQRLSDWMADTSVRDLYKLKAVCEALDVTLDDLLFGDVAHLTDESEWSTGVFELRWRKIK